MKKVCNNVYYFLHSIKFCGFLVCGVKFVNTTGSFESPPRSMRNKIDCIYQIEQPLGYIIELTIKVSIMNRPFSTYCSNYVEVSITSFKVTLKETFFSYK